VPVEKDEAGNILDGFHRARICKELGIEFPVTLRLGMTEDEKVEHALTMNLARRNLTREARREIVVRLRAEGWGLERIAARLGVAEGTVRNDLAVSQNYETDLPSATVGKDGKSYPARKPRTVIAKSDEQTSAVMNALNLTGWEGGNESTLTADEVIKEARSAISEANRNQRLMERTRRAFSEAGSTLNCRLITSDICALSEHIAPQSVDAIITDPPYPKEYLETYSLLAQFAAYALKPGGSLLAMCGQSYLPEIMKLMDGHLPYYWTLNLWTPGQAPHLWQRKVNTNWKPVLWYVNGEYAGETVGDVLKSDENDKRFHGWGQSESGWIQLVERFTIENELIADPFLGGGTGAIVALQCGRRFIGSDISADAVKTTCKRLQELGVTYAADVSLNA